MPREPWSEPLTAQESALAVLVQENQELILQTVAGWLGGPWGAVASYLLGQLIDECTNLNRKNDAFESQLEQSINASLGNLPPMSSRPCPEGVELIPNTLSASAAEIGQPTVLPLVIACDQTVTLTYDLLGHAASPCHQDRALLWIVGARNGSPAIVYRKSVTGIARLFNPESRRARGTEEVALTAGGYAVIVAYTGDHSAAAVTVDYASVPAPPPIWRQPWFQAVAAGTGAAIVAGTATALLTNGGDRR